jgi:hypothetical protein
MISRFVGAGCAGLLLFVGGCNFLGLTEPVVCPDVISRAIEVEVRDAATGQAAAGDAVGIAREGTFTETLEVVGWTSYPLFTETALVLGGVRERPGLYSVRVEKVGYEPWERTGVRAEEGVLRCQNGAAPGESRTSRVVIPKVDD